MPKCSIIKFCLVQRNPKGEKRKKKFLANPTDSAAQHRTALNSTAQHKTDRQTEKIVCNIAMDLFYFYLLVGSTNYSSKIYQSHGKCVVYLLTYTISISFIVLLIIVSLVDNNIFWWMCCSCARWWWWCSGRGRCCYWGHGLAPPENASKFR